MFGERRNHGIATVIAYLSLSTPSLFESRIDRLVLLPHRQEVADVVAKKPNVVPCYMVKLEGFMIPATPHTVATTPVKADSACN